ncbi:MAG: hypothetical protein IJ593_08735 [Lachnospiraceae bacterium]|nr:hypothetical protein [Lachnospiraceae bacterium]
MTEQERYESELNRAVFEKGLDKITYSDILVCKNTPQILIDIGLEDLPILFSKKHFYQSIKPYNKKKHNKGLDLFEDIYKIPSFLNDPMLIMNDLFVDSKTSNLSSKNTHAGDVLVFSNKLDDRLKPIVLSLIVNAQNGIYENVKKEHYLITIFGHENFTNLINIAIKNNAIIYYNNEMTKTMERNYEIKKTQEINQFTGKLVPNTLFSLESNTIIQKYTKNVK